MNCFHKGKYVDLICESLIEIRPVHDGSTTMARRRYRVPNHTARGPRRGGQLRDSHHGIKRRQAGRKLASDDMKQRRQNELQWSSGWGKKEPVEGWGALGLFI
jgi:hypothetical protein